MTQVRRPAVIVDGNAVAGILQDALGGDVTTLYGTCDSCESVAMLAEAVVELDASCAIVQCRACTKTLLTVLIADDVRVIFGALREVRRGRVSPAAG